MESIIKYIKKTWIKRFLLFLKSKIYINMTRFFKRLFITLKNIRKLNKNDTHLKLYYLGIPIHRNLGDLAQRYCIGKWIRENYHDYKVIELESISIVDTPFSLIARLKKCMKSDDLIVFQSGYTTTDLGGTGDKLHRVIIESFPNNKILMMPQTIFFKSEANKLRASKMYNQAKRMLFLARDRVSYEDAIEMFPDVNVKLFPDIVTSLIGTIEYDYKRDGIVMCCRDDSEQFYSSSEINKLKDKLSLLVDVTITDTTKSEKIPSFLKNYETHLFQEIEEYARCKVIITDRFHGVIFSLIAGTPVIILKTTDHKVTAGAEWFDVYSDYIEMADSLEHAYNLALKLTEKPFSYKLQPYFIKEYYNKLPKIWNNVN